MSGSQSIVICKRRKQMYAVTFNAARPPFSRMLMVLLSADLLLLCCSCRFCYFGEKKVLSHEIHLVHSRMSPLKEKEIKA